jgi:endonuclease G
VVLDLERVKRLISAKQRDTASIVIAFIPFFDVGLMMRVLMLRGCLAALLLMLGQLTWALDCRDQYWQGDVPVINNAALAKNTRPLCFNGFAVMHSGVTRTPLWAAEYLTKQRVADAKTLDRVDSFHEEERLPTNERASLNDYRGSGYDRGHLAPNGDMATRAQQSDSFSLANMMPQSPTNNREVWSNLEQAVRVLVAQEGEAYIITGPAFLGQQLRKAKRVLVPSDTYKVVYFPKRQAVSAYWAPNDESGQVQVISLADLEAKLGITFFPTLSNQVRQTRINLPTMTSKVKKNMLGKPLSNEDMRQQTQTGTPSPAPSFDFNTLLKIILDMLAK